MKPVMKLFAFVLIAIVCSTAAAGARGIDQGGRAFVKGSVTKSNKPVSSVWVIVSQGGAERGRQLTGDDGKYYISRLDPGSYDIVVMRGTSQVFKGKITLPKDATFNIKL